MVSVQILISAFLQLDGNQQHEETQFEPAIIIMIIIMPTSLFLTSVLTRQCITKSVSPCIVVHTKNTHSTIVEYKSVPTTKKPSTQVNPRVGTSIIDACNKELQN